MPVRMAVLAGALCLSACGGQGQPQAAATIQVTLPAQPTPVRSVSVDQVAIEQVKAQLRKEPKIRDLVYDPDGAVQWQIGVEDDGTPRHGFADYVCMALAEAGLVAPTTNVRIVDVARLARSNGDFRDASLGRVTCATGQRSDV